MYSFFNIVLVWYNSTTQSTLLKALLLGCTVIWPLEGSIPTTSKGTQSLPIAPANYLYILYVFIGLSCNVFFMENWMRYELEKDQCCIMFLCSHSLPWTLLLLSTSMPVLLTLWIQLLRSEAYSYRIFKILLSFSYESSQFVRLKCPLFIFYICVCGRGWERMGWARGSRVSMI